MLPLSLSTLAQCSVSLWTNAANSAGVLLPIANVKTTDDYRDSLARSSAVAGRV